MDVERIRNEFPSIDGNGSVYLDTAATSLTPECVIRAMDEYYETYRSNVHRGLYSEAVRATQAYEQARATVARFIGALPEEVVFCSGATGASNMLCSSFSRSTLLPEGGAYVVSVMEHHALLLPLQRLAKEKGATLVQVPVTGEMMLDEEAYARLLSERTRLVCITLASNVLGTISAVREYADRAHAYGALVVVDATAGIGHMPVDVRALGADFLFFSGHKMCGPTGIGVLWGRSELLMALEPGYVGGGMVDDVSLSCASWVSGPEKFEAGTQNIAGVLGLAAAVDFIEKIGLCDIRAHTRALTEYLLSRLADFPQVSVYACAAEHNIGIVSFTVRDAHPHDVAEILARERVAVRAGHHCVLPLHSALALPATVRASVYVYTTPGDIDALCKGLEKVFSLFSGESKVSATS